MSGAVVQLVRMPACHAGGRGFDPRPFRQSLKGHNIDVVVFLFIGTKIHFCDIVLSTIIINNALDNISPLNGKIKRCHIQ